MYANSVDKDLWRLLWVWTVFLDPINGRLGTNGLMRRLWEPCVFVLFLVVRCIWLFIKYRMIVSLRLKLFYVYSRDTHIITEFYRSTHH